MTQPMNPREYRAHAERIKATAPTEVVTLTSGTVFELRRPDIQGYVVTGRLPQTLLTEAIVAWKKNGIAAPQALATQLGEKEVIDSLVFMREIVHEACVSPKFVEFATADDEIGAADMLPADFTEIFEWAMGYKGVAGLENLKSFRNRSERRTVSSRARGKKQRDKSQQVAKAEALVS